LEAGRSAPNRFLNQNHLKSFENTHLNTSKIPSKPLQLRKSG
jgi:hypothetical protein